MRKGFLIYEEMRNISPYMRRLLLIFFFISVPASVVYNPCFGSHGMSRAFVITLIFALNANGRHPRPYFGICFSLYVLD